MKKEPEFTVILECSPAGYRLTVIKRTRSLQLGKGTY